MRGHEFLTVIGSDKNLGQRIIEFAKHKELFYYQHLSDSSNYHQITESNADKLVCNAASNFFGMAKTAQEEKEMKLHHACFEKSDMTYVIEKMKSCKRHSQFCTLEH